MLVSSRNVLSFVAMFDVWLAGATEQACSLVMKVDEKEIEIKTIDVTNEFYNGRLSPLKTPKKFRLLPEAPRYIDIAYNYSHARATVVWTPGFEAKFVKYFLLKLVNDKEIDRTPMRYTRYLLHGPVPKLKKKVSYVFKYECVNITNTYKLGINVWSLGSIKKKSQYKVYWISQYSGREEIFRPDAGKVEEGLGKHDSKKCNCPFEITISKLKKCQILITIYNNRQRLDFEVVLTKRRFSKTKRFSSNPTKNVTILSLQSNHRLKIFSKEQVQVFRLCDEPDTQVKCSFVESKPFHSSWTTTFGMTDYFTFL